MKQVRDDIYRLEDSDLGFLRSISAPGMDFEEIYHSIELDGLSAHLFMAEGKEVSIGITFEGYFVPYDSEGYRKVLDIHY